jgi:hypothetical protein
LATYEKAIGRDHPEIAPTLVDFASLLEKQGRNSDAVLLLERALHINERTLAPDHPDLEKIRRDIRSLRAADASESART